jgi:hypothetical protein
MRFFLATLAMAASVSAAPTFYRDVLAVLQRNCQSCHRAGEAAMALLTYQDARPWASAEPPFKHEPTPPARPSV